MCSNLSGELIWLCFIEGNSQKVMCKRLSRVRAFNNEWAHMNIQMERQ